ncbi:hypothetical protein J2W55_002914 [Mucilaginibacter pocheonensis]|uniref:Uncharacterized protein n=1 Tax=Mucilaginibacter pocheonensis TaxID=398050 RepID=A0ABU1TCS0_9SPHI|nr:hypothetical protein [Mucilaginibacter pocheonensis]
MDGKIDKLMRVVFLPVFLQLPAKDFLKRYFNINAPE